jgi:lipopolysaccharide transport system permease protein
MGVAERIPGSHFVRILLRNRSLIYQLVRRDFQMRYVGSMAGWLWGLIHPLVLLGVYTFVFVYAFGIKLPPEEVTQNYPLFLFAGMLPWMLFSESLQRSASALPEYSNLIKKSVFPAEVVPLTIFLSNLISHFLAVALMLVAAAIWLGQVSWTVIVLPFYVLILGLLTVGLSWIAAGLHVYLRDTAQILSVVLTAWFWLTPIFLYEEILRDKFDGRLAFLLVVNPMAYMVRFYRSTLLGNEISPWLDLLLMGLFSAVIFVAGGLFFRRMKRGFADVL